ncbi:uncharacterized protein LOC143195745 [Rhynchophorus ferrugineus]|uniref:uncharacterized protein LOC143195745 n=1 Tax=Rhynchophorus ferrugineus TaxID=354439 RepID=UPI003FCCBC61
MEQQHFQGKLGDDMFKVTKNFMLLIGSWRMKSANPRTILLYKMYGFTIMSIFITLTTLTAIKLSILLIEGNEMNLVIEQVGKITMAFILLLKFRIFGTKRMADVFLMGIKDTNEAAESNQDIRNIIVETVTYCNRTNFILVGLTIAAGTLYDVNIIIEAYQFEEKHNFSVRPIHLLSSYCPYEEHFYILFIAENCIAIYVILLICSYQTLLNSIMNNAVGRIRVLHYHFKCFGDNETSDSEKVLQEKLKSLLQNHQKLILDMADLNKAINIAILIEYVISSLMIASMIVQFLLVRDNYSLN